MSQKQEEKKCKKKKTLQKLFLKIWEEEQVKKKVVLQLRRGANSKSKMTAFSKIVEQEEKVGVTLAKKKKKPLHLFISLLVGLSQRMCIGGSVQPYAVKK